MSLDQEYDGEVEDWSDDDLGEVEQPGFEWPAEEYEGGGLERIHERMEELAEQQAALAERLEAGVPEYDEDFDPDEYDDDDVEVGAPDVMNLIEGSLDAREAEYQVEYDIAERDQAFEELREQVPELMNQRFAGAAVGEAVEMCRDQGREDLIETPTFVGLVEVAAKALLMQHYEQRSAERMQAQEVQLGSAQGARPEDSGQIDWGDRMLAAAEQMRPRI